jgi:hypothetical protein
MRKTIKKFFNKNVSYQNNNWYVLISIISSALGLLISIYTLLVPISNILANVNTLTKDISELKYSYTSVYNPQDIDTSRFNWWKLISKYITSLNIWDYQLACSLISTLQCTMFDVKWFTNWVWDKKRYLTVKLKDWEKLIKTWNSWEKLENTNIETWCAKIEYYLGTEDTAVNEIRQYYILNRPDWKKEIWKILCEYADKNWEERTKQICWYIVQKKVCKN